MNTTSTIQTTAKELLERMDNLKEGRIKVRKEGEDLLLDIHRFLRELSNTTTKTKEQS